MSFGLDQQISRTPVTLVVITLDRCSNTFGVAPCTATGTPCYNTWKTCKDKPNFSRTTQDYEYTSADAPLPWPGPRPYLRSVRLLPTEIKDTLTVKGRVSIEMEDEPDTDVGLDPYLDQRNPAPPPASYWKRLFARSPNFAGRRVEVYEGFLGQAREQFSRRWAGYLETVDLSKGKVKIEAADPLKKLGENEVPAKFDGKVVGQLAADAMEVILSKVDGLDPSGYVRIEDEILRYESIVSGQNKLIIYPGDPQDPLDYPGRGYFGTEAAEHSGNAKVQPVRYYEPMNGFDRLVAMLRDEAEIDPEFLNTAAFDDWRDWSTDEVPVSAVITKPTKLDELFFELVDLLDCRVWYSEGQQITIARNIPNRPGYGLVGGVMRHISDETTLVHQAGSAELNAESRINVAVLRWDMDPLGDRKKSEDYRAEEIAVDTDAVSENEDGKTIEGVVNCRWLRRGYLPDETMEGYAASVAKRRVWRRRDLLPIIEFAVEIKDAGLLTGDWLRISTDELLRPDGTPFVRELFQIVRRDPKGDQIKIRARWQGDKKLCIITPDDQVDYAAADREEREYGYLAADDGTMPGGETPGYCIY